MLLKKIRDWAGSRGLLLGVAPTRPFTGGQAALEWRLARGYTTPFVCGRLEERYQPLLLYPAARSIIVVAKPCLEPEKPPESGQGWIANYALGVDYHFQLKSFLRELAFILEENGAKLVAIQVDNGPLLEREAAYLSGLGYYGANCNLIIPGYGSHMALGLLLTDLELEPGVPITAAACINCGRCVAACPTDALKAPGRLNPQRCLSYLTQARGIIPLEMRPLLGQRIWGCDTCQEVCPVNQRERLQIRSSGKAYFQAATTTYLDLAAIITMDNRDFNRAFKNTALAWRGKTCLQRNAAVALGNWGEVTALEYLQQALLAPSVVLRGHAAWALGRLGPEGRFSLEKAWKRETEPYVQQEIERAVAANK